MNRYLLQIDFLETSPFEDFFPVIHQSVMKTRVLISFLLELVPAIVLFKARLNRVYLF